MDLILWEAHSRAGVEEVPFQVEQSPEEVCRESCYREVVFRETELVRGVARSKFHACLLACLRLFRV